MKQKSWISIVFSFASQCRGKIALSVLCAIISVIAGLIPYWSVYQIITLFIGGSPVMAEVWKWCWIGLGAVSYTHLIRGCRKFSTRGISQYDWRLLQFCCSYSVPASF